MEPIPASKLAPENIVSIGTRHGLELAIKRRVAKDLGKVILHPDSADLIAGVERLALQVGEFDAVIVDNGQMANAGPCKCWNGARADPASTDHGYAC